ncbi:hypothetical protein QYF61_005655 [Mycteria americana]|uniref:PH domain-containing protein n=1 Tax=Mycteria americana TaxID=33587 RepID=A0AAN7RWZ8_MYCAM|nr:hypothetical protein QYF61_005655 [Mycteria americana]
MALKMICFITFPGTEAPSSPSSPIANEPKYEKRWLDTLSVPLSMARISRSNAFEVLALDGVSTGILQFYTAQESADWLRAISTNISDLTLQNGYRGSKARYTPTEKEILAAYEGVRAALEVVGTEAQLLLAPRLPVLGWMFKGRVPSTHHATDSTCSKWLH